MNEKIWLVEDIYYLSFIKVERVCATFVVYDHSQNHIFFRATVWYDECFDIEFEDCEPQLVGTYLIDQLHMILRQSYALAMAKIQVAHSMPMEKE